MATGARWYAAVGAAGFLASAPAAGARAAVTVVDQGGRTVVLDAAPRRIADLWFAHNALLVMLGAADVVAATVDPPASYPWMYRVAPALHQAVQLPGTAPNAETLLARKVDLVFGTPNLTALDAVRRAGIPTVQVQITDFATLRRCVALTAEVLQTGLARERARRYDAFLEATLELLRTRLAVLPDAARPRVLHVESLDPLRVDGSGTLIDDWIRLAGGRNAAEGLRGNRKPVSLEQVVAWNPDVVILGAKAGAFDAASAPELWRAVTAVHDRKVFRDPAGVFLWDRYGPEAALQLRWAARALHPDLFRDADMVAVTRGFYRDLFGYALSADEATRILQGLPPA